MRKVEVCAYNEAWLIMFKEEENKLANIFEDELVALHHIGSTAVRGLQAKPIIDIMPVVRDIEKVDNYNQAMIEIGYEPRGENGIPKRRYFQKGGDNRTHHVHIFQVGSEDITRHLAFREYLSTFPQVKKEYGELKQSLAQQFPYEIAAYIEGKDGFVKEMEQRALKWYQK
ncbi:GrpB-like predicted nucleotidyltransferase (UPF0157 family) [Evansella vedderi]|uniref:GrpB-like predicted nucleotidyltransferase (UPF0157 family) n=1 Tax=Evansella vedderi TaxID=38282 RepID=A0ABT9ZSU4_9BACI|nr:GrpB family protein [Evansella vedderi]MDQ0253553.1 GrpB-like predicted nucleotidyltransferase (UPF0157 family) [Evansella vedderi]